MNTLTRHLRLSIKQLDEMSCCKAYGPIRARLLAAYPDPSQSLGLGDALAAGCTFHSVRDLLFPLARLAQSDREVRDLLTCFINDSAISSLPSFDAKFPLDPRPRLAIEATEKLAAGSVATGEWHAVALAGLAAWAAFFAPEPLVASGAWAAADAGKAGGWQSWSDCEQDWARWAEWAVLSVRAHLGEKAGGLALSDGADADPAWTIERLVQYISNSAPAKLAILPQGHLGTLNHLATAAAIDEFEIDWSHFVAFPSGLQHLAGARLEKNATLVVPDGVESIGRLTMVDGPEDVRLPASLRVIDELYLDYGSTLRLNEGIEKIVCFKAFDCEVLDFPSSLGRIDRLELDCECTVAQTQAVIGELGGYFDPEEDDVALVFGVHRVNRPAADINLAAGTWRWLEEGRVSNPI